MNIETQQKFELIEQLVKNNLSDKEISKRVGIREYQISAIRMSMGLYKKSGTWRQSIDITQEPKKAYLNKKATCLKIEFNLSTRHLQEMGLRFTPTHFRGKINGRNLILSFE